MREINNQYKYPYVERAGEGENAAASVVVEKLEGSGSASWNFSTVADAENAIAFARSMQVQGIALNVHIKIMHKKNK